MVELNTLFRSIVNIRNTDGKPTISQDDLLENFRSMQQHVPAAPEDKAYSALYHFILDFVKSETGGKPNLPGYEVMKRHFEEVEGNEAAIAALERVRTEQPYVGGDFRRILRQYNDDMDVLKLQRILSNVDKIAASGLEIKGPKGVKIKLQGISDSMSYFAREARALQRMKTGLKTQSQIVSVEDAEEMSQEYDRAEADPSLSLGINTWLEKIDLCTGGLKNTELMFVAAFAAHCKTTFCLNMSYRALWSGYNSGYVSLEMSFDEIRRHMYVLHSANPKFRDTWPEYADVVGKITYNNVRYGKLNDKEKRYWKKIIQDFNRNFNEKSDEYGRFFIWQPETTVTTLSDVELKMREWQQELAANSKDQLDLIALDYITMLTPDKEHRATDSRQSVNNMLKALKALCLTFDGGRGVRGISPFQVSRKAYLEALQNKGIYFKTAMSDYNEAERSCDVAISLFKKIDLRGEEEGKDDKGLRICCLKNRRNDDFAPFDACVDFPSGYIYDYDFGDLVESTGVVLAQ